jgi:hypothetical protein
VTDTVMAGGSREIPIGDKSAQGLPVSAEYDTFFTGWKRIFHGTFDHTYIQGSGACVQVTGTAFKPGFGPCD